MIFVELAATNFDLLRKHLINEFLLSRKHPIPQKDDTIIFKCELGRMMSARVRSAIPSSSLDAWLLELSINSVFPWGLREPSLPVLDSNQAAEWFFLQADSFRVLAARLEIPRKVKTQLSDGVRYKFTYTSRDLWEAALKLRIQEHRLNRINEREKNHHFRGALTQA